MARLRIFTWHVHGNYLWYLSQIPHDIYLPVRSDPTMGYGGRGKTFPFGDNVHDVPVEEVHRTRFDCILFQHSQHYIEDQYTVLSSSQRRLPRIFVQHDPPLDHPTDQRHWCDDPKALLVHVTPFNALMWDSGRTPTRVIDHGVPDLKDVQYSGEIARGIVVINHLSSRGRRLGPDVFERARQEVPLDLVGMEAETCGGIGEISPTKLAAFTARYRFMFNPIRYTSLGLAVCEAMMLGMPIVGLATTEMATAVQNGVSGFVDTDVGRLVEGMRLLLDDPAEARRMGANARRYAQARFGMQRFIAEWDDALRHVAGGSIPPVHTKRTAHATAIGTY